MSIALSEFWTRLVRSGITDAAGCKRLAAAYSQGHGGTPPSDSETLARFMISVGKLTEFQARALLADPPREIRIGRFVIRSERCSPPLSRWVGAARVADGQTGVLFQLRADQTPADRLQWFETHQQVSGPGIQAFDLEPLAGATLVFSPLPDGRCLHELISQGATLSPARVCEIGIAIASALHVLHSHPLIHGAVRADRIWIPDAGGDAILLRDPSGPPCVPGVELPSPWIDSVESAAWYAAPEFAAGQQACTASTDIYSLGCLLFRLVSGRLPFGGESAKSITAPPVQMPAELSDAVARGEAGDPLYRVLAYTMANNPAARFAVAQQLAEALRATLRLLPSAAAASEPAASTPEAAPPVTAAEPPAAKGTVGEVPTIQAKPRAGKAEKSRASRGKKQPSRSSQKPPTAPPRQPDKPSPVSKPVPTRKPASVEKPPRPESAPPKVAARSSESIPPREKPDAQPSSPRAIAAVETSSASQPGASRAEPPAAADRPIRRRRKKSSKAPFVLGALCVVVLMLVIALAVYDPSEPMATSRPRPPIPDVIPSVSGRKSPPRADERAATPSPQTDVQGYQLVSDERLLFAPPYPAETPMTSLEMLPPGPAVIISARLSSVAQSQTGSDLITALSPELSGILDQVVQRTGVSVPSIDRCAAALHPGKDGWPEVSLVIDLVAPRAADEMLETWQVAASRTRDGVTIYAGDALDADAFYFVPGDDGTISRFAVGSVQRISEVAANEGGAIPLPRSSQSLWNRASQEADLAVLVTPNFLFADGRAMLQSSAPRLAGPLRELLQPDVAAALLLAKLGEANYLELRLAASGGVSEAALLQSIRQAIQSWPAWADEFIVESVPEPSWRLLANRLPSMMRFVVDRSRYGISGGEAVVNSYLPAPAISQLTLATLLAMNTPSGGATSGAVAAPADALTLDQMLGRRMSVSFDQESLEFAIDAIANAFKQSLPAGSSMPAVRIIGGDLQLMGITQNQQVRDFSKSELPLRTVLTDLVVGANPDKSATGPQDPKQALIWVVADDPQNPGQKAILITTRQAAEGKYSLPAEFRGGA